MSESQKRVDAVIHYRNLAIRLGAQPESMLNDYDRRLCATKETIDWDAEDAWKDDAPDIYEENESLKAEVERLGKLVRECWCCKDRRLMQEERIRNEEW